MFNGEKVLLRALTRDDMKKQWEFENDPEIWYWDGYYPKPTKLETVIGYFEQSVTNDNPNSVSWAIDVDGDYIGYCSLSGFDQTSRHCELQVEIGNKMHWGNGLGREVVAILLDYAFTHRNMHRVWLKTHSKNERALRCYLACGFVEEGRLRQHVWLKGEYIDRVFMGVLRSDYDN